jgi:hypothetical protein
MSLVRGSALCLVALLFGCATAPPAPESPDFRSRIETQTIDGIRASAVVLSPLESVHIFKKPLAENGIQPVWLEIENQGDKEFYLMLLSIDPNYFTPSEIAWIFQGDGDGSLDDKIDFFLQKHIRIIVPPHDTVSGYVYTNIDPGAKAFGIELLGIQEIRSFSFFQLVPGFEADFMGVAFEKLYDPADVRNLDLEGLRRYLETLPCCVTGGDRETPGDPLNLVFVGSGQQVLATLVRRGWDLTETVRADTTWRTAVSSIFGSRYRTSPVSALYLFDRPQDASFQKARSTVDERNHLRLWLAPVTLDGQLVWIGQISRDIGVKFSSKTFVTHKIDPYVDEARLYIALDLTASGTLQAIGYVKGVGYSGRDAPRFNYTDDPYYTDGLRVVLILGEARQPLDTINFLSWEQVMPLRRLRKDSGSSSSP